MLSPPTLTPTPTPTTPVPAKIDSTFLKMTTETVNEVVEHVVEDVEKLTPREVKFDVDVIHQPMAPLIKETSASNIPPALALSIDAFGMAHSGPIRTTKTTEVMALFPAHALGLFLACARRYLLHRRLERELRLLLVGTDIPYEVEEVTIVDPMDTWLFKAKDGPSSKCIPVVLMQLCQRIQRCFCSYANEIRYTLDTLRFISASFSRLKKTTVMDSTYLIFRREDADIVHRLTDDVIRRFRHAKVGEDTYRFYGATIPPNDRDRGLLHVVPVRTIKSITPGRRRTMREIGLHNFIGGTAISPTQSRRLGIIKNRGMKPSASELSRASWLMRSSVNNFPNFAERVATNLISVGGDMLLLAGLLTRT